MALEIKRLAPKNPPKHGLGNQPELPLEIAKEREIEGIGMGVLSDGTPYLNQRGLALLCGVQNAHIGTISRGWNDPEPTARVERIKAILADANVSSRVDHFEFSVKGTTHFAYPGRCVKSSSGKVDGFGIARFPKAGWNSYVEE